MTNTNTQSETARLQEISDILVQARLAAGSLSEFPGPLPVSLNEAYQVQHLSRKVWPDRVIGWKVGGIPPIHREAMGADFLSGPIFASRFVRASLGQVSEMPVFAEGFAAVEAELVLELGETREHDRLFLGAEIASSPIVNINGVGPLAVVSDFGNNNGVLKGPELNTWQQGLSEPLYVATFIDDVCVGEREITDIVAHVARARNFLFDHAKVQGFDLPTGTLISTGAITGVHSAKVGAHSLIRFGDMTTLEIVLTPVDPHQ